jgi:hypothetical protein
MNDRALRRMIIGLEGKKDGVPREGGFMITAASEAMAILCLAKDHTAGIYIFEGLVNLDRFTTRKFFLIGLSLRIDRVTWSPVRAVALIQNDCVFNAHLGLS